MTWMISTDARVANALWMLDKFVVTILPEVVFSRKRAGLDLSGEFAADGL